MILSVARCPYRISLLGGGSDLDWFYRIRQSRQLLGIFYSGVFSCMHKIFRRKKGYIKLL